jgi:formylglycine-generating enzyme
MNASRAWVSVCVVIGLGASTAVANFTMQTVAVGNPGNTGRLAGAGAGGKGDDRICGAVGYAYSIGKYEVTAAQYCQFLNAVAKTDTYGLYNEKMADQSFLSPSYVGGCNIQRSGSPGSYTYSVAADWANRPVNYVSFWDACRFVNWLHNSQPTGAQGAGTTETGAYTLNGYVGSDGRTIQRNPGARWVLPSEDEWYKAAYHKNNGVTGDYFNYPTSSDTAPSHMYDPGGANNANYNLGFDYINPIYTIGSPYYRTEVGAFANVSSPYGTFDQGGNVWEWNDALMSQESGFRGIRGGSFDKRIDTLHAAYRGNTVVTTEYFSVGFRVVYLPEPGSALLVVVGGFAGVVRRRLRQASSPRRYAGAGPQRS